MPISANVEKRDKRIEPFMPEKIALSCMKAGLGPDDAHSIALEVSKKVYMNIPTSEIRKMVSKQLQKYNKKAAKAYMKNREEN